MSKSIKCTKVNPNVNCGPWVIMICQWRFISCNKHPTLVSNGDNGGNYAYIRTKDIWEISVPFFQFCYGPKTALKKKSP